MLSGSSALWWPVFGIEYAIKASKPYFRADFGSPRIMDLTGGCQNQKLMSDLLRKGPDSSLAPRLST